MSQKTFRIRVASIKDAEELLLIYAPYVTETAITFEYEVPSIEEFRKRIQRTLENYPYIVAECDGELLGYAYTGVFKDRAAYDWSVETSIYIKGEMKGLGIGRKLYEAIERISKAQNILNLNACISYPEICDQYLTRNSVEFHEYLGFQMVGEFHKCGYKFCTWYNMVWMEKLLGSHTSAPLPVIPFSQMSADVLRDIGIEL